MHLEPIGVRPVSVHSLNPLLSCLFLVSSSSPPPPSVSALYWRPEGQGYSATDMEHWVFKPKLPLIIRTSQVASTRKDERVCNLNLALLHQQKILRSCVLVQPLNVSLPKYLTSQNFVRLNTAWQITLQNKVKSIIYYINQCLWQLMDVCSEYKRIVWRVLCE